MKVFPQKKKKKKKKKKKWKYSQKKKKKKQKNLEYCIGISNRFYRRIEEDWVSDGSGIPSFFCQLLFDHIWTYKYAISSLFVWFLPFFLEESLPSINYNHICIYLWFNNLKTEWNSTWFSIFFSKKNNISLRFLHFTLEKSIKYSFDSIL